MRADCIRRKRDVELVRVAGGIRRRRHRLPRNLKRGTAVVVEVGDGDGIAAEEDLDGEVEVATLRGRGGAEGRGAAGTLCSGRSMLSFGNTLPRVLARVRGAGGSCAGARDRVHALSCACACEPGRALPGWVPALVCLEPVPSSE